MKTSPARENEPSFSTKQKVQDKPKWMGQLEWLCGFTILFTGYLWYSSPVKTTAQFYFRLTLLTAGVVGYVLIQLLKWSRTRNATSR